MRKLLLPILAVVSLVAVGAAAGSTTKTVTISHAGYTPTAVSITTGDTVVFKNTDSVAHTVKFDSTTGVQCTSVVPLVIQPAGSASCTFSTAGKFKFSDPASNKKAFKGTITVTPPLASSLTATPTYGHTSTLAGTLASGQSGQTVAIHARACNAPATLAGTVTTTAGGAFTYQAQPSSNTTYVLSTNGSSSTSTVAVSVKPRVHLAKIGAHCFQVKIYAAHNFLGERVTFQRYRSSSKRWVAVKRVDMHSIVTKSPTVMTSAKFHSSIKPHLHVRVSLGPKQARPCYLPANSNAIHS